MELIDLICLLPQKQAPDNLQSSVTGKCSVTSGGLPQLSGPRAAKGALHSETEACACHTLWAVTSQLGFYFF